MNAVLETKAETHSKNVDPMPEGQSLTYTSVVTNNGPDVA